MSGANRGYRLYERARRLMPGGTQLLSKRPEMFLPEQWPCYYSRAEGPWVWDLDGRQYLDMSINGVGCCPLGYADPDVNSAVIEAVRAGSMTTLNCPEEVELADLLCQLHPWAQQVRLARCGGETMALAVRIARAQTGREKVAVCGYHGWMDWYLAANLTAGDPLGGEGLLLAGLEPRGVPNALAGSTLVFHFNRLDELSEIAANHEGQLAAIVTEPQRFEKPQPEFLEGMRRIADENRAVLIFDEITSGLRLTTGGAHLMYGVTPDLAVFGKGLGNGFPIGAVVGKQETMDAAQTTFLSSTFWTERVGPVAALATLKKHAAIQAAEKMKAAGRSVQQLWHELAVANGLDVEVGHADMTPLAHLKFRYPNRRAVQTLHCQLMLERGILDNATFYATAAHTEHHLRQYRRAVAEVFPILADACQRGTVESQLDGPVGHSGFQRLT